MLPSLAAAAGQHVVAPGETLSGIADHYGVAASALAAVNGLADLDHIEVGQLLRINDGVVVAEAAPRTGSGRTYVIQPGDTLSGIADQFGISWQALAAANGLEDGDSIIAGQVLHVNVGAETVAYRPTATSQRTHRVLAGESLSAIADEYGVPIQAVIEANAIIDPNHVVEGDVLVIPVQRGGAVAPAEGDVRAMLRSAAHEFGVDAELVLAIAWQESGWNQAMVSSAGAIGVMQVLPSTGDWAAEELVSGADNWRYDARANARVGAAILADMLINANWDVHLAIASYYQGLHSIESIGWYDDTEAYVANVIALWGQMSA